MSSPPPDSHLDRGDPGWRTLGREVHYENAHLAVATHLVLTPTRADEAHPARWTVVHRKPAIVVAPWTAAGEFVLIRQERIPVGAALWEFPAGQIDDEARAADEGFIRETALRELREEAGLELPPGSELEALGHFFPSPGFTDERNHLFLARGVVEAAGGRAPTEHEAITDRGHFSPARLQRMIASGEVRDANTLSLCARLWAGGWI